MTFREHVPWWTKVAAKIVLKQIPLKRRHWERLGLFVHGEMDTPEYAFRVVMSHLERVGWQDLGGKSVLEIGPGDGLFTALIAKALGAQHVYLVDAEPAAVSGIEVYRSGCDYLQRAGLQPPDLSRCATVEEMLRICHAEYLTNGLDSLGVIPPESIDLVFSQAVLEHVRIAEFSPLLDELRRIMSPRGVASHEVDLKDHLAGALNNLRFSTRVWESPFMADSGFYTNRLRFQEILDLFTQAGFSVEVREVHQWERPPTAPRCFAAEFQHFSEEDLLVSEFGLLASPV